MTEAFPPIEMDPRHAWLALVLPVCARRFETDDPDVARILVDAGAEITDTGADVEIASHFARFGMVMLIAQSFRSMERSAARSRGQRAESYGSAAQRGYA